MWTGYARKTKGQIILLDKRARHSRSTFCDTQKIIMSWCLLTFVGLLDGGGVGDADGTPECATVGVGVGLNDPGA